MRPKVVAAAVAIGVVGVVVLLARFGPSGSASPDRGLVLHLPLDADFKDHSRFGHAVTATGNVRFDRGAAYFPGDESWLTAPHLGLDGKPFAISMWIKPAHDLFPQGLFEQRDDDTTNRHLHLVLNRGWPYFGFMNNDAQARKRLRKDQWNHLVCVFTGQQQVIWLDGKPVFHSASGPYQGQQGDTHIGRHPRLPHLREAANFQGWMRDVRVYEGLVENERVLALHQRRPAGL
jgi:hypothetical protein